MSALQQITDHVKDAMEELTCPICLSVATDAVVLSCGHLGCEEHIAEWLARKPECPTCRAEVGTHTVKSHALDGVLSKLALIQTCLDKAVMDRALTRTTSSDGSTGMPASSESFGGVDQIEKLFRVHIRTALQTASTYAIELQAERDAIVRAADTKLEAVRAALTAAANTGSGATDSAGKLAEAQAEHDEAVAGAKADFDKKFGLLLQDVEGYLGETAVPVKLLPSTISVSIPSVGARFDAKIRPMDTIDGCIKPVVARVVAETLGLDTVEYDDDVAWTWEAPGSASSAPLAVGDPIYRQCPRGRPDPGATLTCKGTVKAYSALASKCLVDVWTAGMKQDYFWCTTCSLKWICSCCAKACHGSQGHNVVPFLTNHVPTFACCYCRTRSTKCTVGKKPSAAK